MYYPIAFRTCKLYVPHGIHSMMHLLIKPSNPKLTLNPKRCDWMIFSPNNREYCDEIDLKKYFLTMQKFSKKCQKKREADWMFRGWYQIFFRLLNTYLTSYLHKIHSFIHSSIYVFCIKELFWWNFVSNCLFLELGSICGMMVLQSSMPEFINFNFILKYINMMGSFLKTFEFMTTTKLEGIFSNCSIIAI